MIRLEERGLREIGVWPSDDLGTTFLALLDQRIEVTTDPVEKSRLQRFREGATAIGSGVLVNVLSDLIRRGWTS